MIALQSGGPGTVIVYGIVIGAVLWAILSGMSSR